MKWLFNWAIAYATPYLVNYGPGYANLQSKIFFVWFAACFLCIAFVYFFIYETKGLTLEEVDEMYNDVSSARKSTKWSPHVTFRERESVSAKGGAPEGADGLQSGHSHENGQLEHDEGEKRSGDVAV